MRKPKVRAVTLALLAAAAVLTAVGIAVGEPTVVWQKASNVCMECIGIG
jgi:hypothetical protein